MVAALVRHVTPREVKEMLPEGVHELMHKRGYLRRVNPMQDPTRMALTDEGRDWLRRVLA